jgi:hypothetical protein
MSYVYPSPYFLDARGFLRTPIRSGYKFCLACIQLQRRLKTDVYSLRRKIRSYMLVAKRNHALGGRPSWLLERERLVSEDLKRVDALTQITRAEAHR